MPTSSSLVTNLPADFNTFGQGVDTSLQYLLGGTTGQVLSKTSGTNMAFTWVTPTDQTPLTTKGDLFAFSTVDARLPAGANETRLVADSAQTLGLKYVADTTNYAIAAKADLLVGTAADTLAALTVGTNGQVLTADSTVSPTGLKWATPAVSASGLTLVSTTSFTTASSVSTGSVFSATYTNYKIFINISACTAVADLAIRLRISGTDNSTAGNYLYQNFTTGGINNSDAHGSSWSGASATSFAAGSTVSNAGFQNRWVTMELLSPFETFKTGYSAEAMEGNAGPYDYAKKIIGRMDVTTSYDAFTIIPSSGTITGKVSVYGYAI